MKLLTRDSKPVFQLREGRMWHARAYALAKGLLPLESALVSHLAQSYTRNHQKSRKGAGHRSKSPLSKLNKSGVRGTSIKRKRKVCKGKGGLVTRPPTPGPSIVRGNKALLIDTQVPTPQLTSSGECTDKSNVVVKYNIHSSISEPQLKNKVKKPDKGHSGSDSSFDSNYFRDHFVISSNDLYGASNSEESEAEEVGRGVREEEPDLLDSTGGEKYDYMPLIFNAEKGVTIERLAAQGKDST